MAGPGDLGISNRNMVFLLAAVDLRNDRLDGTSLRSSNPRYLQSEDSLSFSLFSIPYPKGRV
jgi:hypothetical protein